MSTQAQDGNNYLSIPDFTMHRVTPEKTFNPALSNKTEIKNGIPKLRTVNQPEQKLQPQPIKSDRQIKLAEGSAKTQTNQQPVKDSSAQAVSESKKHEIADTQKKTENNSNQTSSSDSPDEIISKINQINEKNQSSAKGNFDKNNMAQEKGNDFLRAFSSLIIVLLLILAFAWVYARVKGINPTAILTGKFSEKDLNKFNVLSTSTLGQGKDIHLVEINGKQLVIGSTANNINLLTEIPPEEIQKLKEKSQKKENAETENTEPVEFLEEDEIYYESIEDEEFMDPNSYSLKYSEVYKDYIDKKDPEE